MADDTKRERAWSELAILVCSANIGNAEPTPESFGEWVPDDGEIEGPLSRTKYPVEHAGTAHVTASLRGAEGKKFDILVLGMQEAAFVGDRASPAGSDRRLDASDKSGASDKVGAGDKIRVRHSIGPGNVDLFRNAVRANAVAGADGVEVVEFVEAGSERSLVRTGDGPGAGTINLLRKSAEADGAEGGGKKSGMACAFVDAVHSEISEAKTKGRTKRQGVFHKADKTKLVVRGLTTTKSFRSHSQHGDKVDGIKESALRSGGYDTRKFIELIENRCPSYKMISANLRGQMRLIVLALEDVAKEISDVYNAGENTGIGSILANKGGMITTFNLRRTRLSFMTAHLEAHEGGVHYANRNKNLVAIFAGAKTDPHFPRHDATVISHHMFVCGDLNYRIKFGDAEPTTKRTNSRARDIVGKQRSRRKSKGFPATPSLSDPPPPVPDGPAAEGGEAANGPPVEVPGEVPVRPPNFAQAKALVDAEDWGALNDGDELASALEKKECLVGFQTLPCNFPPTFKVTRGEGYQYNEKRTPSYTDRILWKSAHGMTNNIVPFLYEPCPDFITSDHKPIRGGYVLKMNEASPSGQPPAQTTAPLSLKSNERQVHLLVSGIKCTNLPVMDSEIMGGMADPYILFVSDPKPILRKKAWPSTKVIKRSLNPDWDEDIHLTLDGDGCRDEGGSISLNGSMLYMTVMDEDFSTGDDVIGTVALSLNELCSELDTRGRNGNSSRDTIQKTTISKPILQHGQERGTLECTISSAFLTAKGTAALLLNSKNVTSKMKKTTLTNKISAFLHFS